jgi:hypothetical protein
MAFDLSTAKPDVPEVSGGFDLSTAKPDVPVSAPAPIKTDPGVLDILMKRGGEAYQGFKAPFDNTTAYNAVGAIAKPAMAAGGAINDLFGLALKKVTGTGLGKELSEPFAQSGKALLGPAVQSAGEFLKDKPQLTKDITGLADASGLFLVSPAAKVISPAAKEAGNFVADVGSRAARSAGKTAAKLGPDPEGLIQTGAKWKTTLPPEEAKKLSRTMIDEKLTLNPAGYESLENTITSVNNDIKAGLKPHSNKPIAATDVIKRTSEARKKAESAYDAATETAKVDAEVQRFLDNWDGKLTVGKAQTIKQDIYRQLKKHYDSVGKGGPGLYADGEIAAKKNIARGLKEEIEISVPDANIKALNARESQLLNLEPHMRRAVGRIGNHNIMSLDDVLATTAGAVLGGPVAGVAAGVAKRALGSPAMKSRLAMALDTLANPSAPPPLKSEALRTAQQIMDATNPRTGRPLAPSIDAPLSNPPAITNPRRVPTEADMIKLFPGKKPWEINWRGKKETERVAAELLAEERGRLPKMYEGTQPKVPLSDLNEELNNRVEEFIRGKLRGRQ